MTVSSTQESTSGKGAEIVAISTPITSLSVSSRPICASDSAEHLEITETLDHHVQGVALGRRPVPVEDEPHQASGQSSTPTPSISSSAPVDSPDRSASGGPAMTSPGLSTVRRPASATASGQEK